MNEGLSYSAAGNMHLLNQPVLPSFARARGFTAVFVFLGSLLVVSLSFLVVCIKVRAVILFRLRLRLSVHVKHVFTLFHLLQELIHGLKEAAQSDMMHT